MLVRLQNPSIRDFMERLLLAGELLQETIESAVFFEQAEWLAESIMSEKTKLSANEIARYESMIVSALQRLLDADEAVRSM